MRTKYFPDGMLARRVLCLPGRFAAKNLLTRAAAPNPATLNSAVADFRGHRLRSCERRKGIKDVRLPGSPLYDGAAKHAFCEFCSLKTRIRDLLTHGSLLAAARSTQRPSVPARRTLLLKHAPDIQEASSMQKGASPETEKSNGCSIFLCRGTRGTARTATSLPANDPSEQVPSQPPPLEAPVARVPPVFTEQTNN